MRIKFIGEVGRTRACCPRAQLPARIIILTVHKYHANLQNRFSERCNFISNSEKSEDMCRLLLEFFLIKLYFIDACLVSCMYRILDFFF